MLPPYVPMGPESIACFSGGHADAAERRMREKLEFHVLAEGSRCRDRSPVAIQIPALRVAAPRLQPLIAAVRWKQPLDRLWRQSIGRDSDAVPAPITVQTHAVEPYDERITRLRSFYIERAGKHIVAIQDELARFVTAA